MSPLMNYTRRRKVKNIILDLLIALVVIICVFPFVWMFMTSIKTRVQTNDPELGDPDARVKPGTSFDDLPEDWVCPVCGASKDLFEKE
jgi:rubredoxin